MPAIIRQESLPHTPSPLCLPISNEDAEQPSRFQEMKKCRSSSALCRQQVNDNATNLANLHRASSKPSYSSTRRRLGRHRRHKRGGSETRPAPEAEDDGEDAHVSGELIANLIKNDTVRQPPPKHSGALEEMGNLP